MAVFSRGGSGGGDCGVEVTLCIGSPYRQANVWVHIGVIGLLSIFIGTNDFSNDVELCEII